LLVLNFLLGSLAMVFTALWTDTLPYNVYMVFREVSALLYCFGGNNWQKCGWWCEYVCNAIVLLEMVLSQAVKLPYCG